MRRRRPTAPRPHRPRAAALLGAAALVMSLFSCAGSANRAHVGGRDTESSVGRGVRGAPIELVRSPARDEIAVLEDRRSLGDGRLLALLAHEDAAVRGRAAEALGRFPFPDFGATVTDALCLALDDPDPSVRLAAAFALGVRADPASGGVLMAYRNDPDPRMRARVVEAVSKIDDPLLHRDLLTALRDSDLGVRIEAAVGTALWNTEEAGAADVDRALLDALRPYTLSTRPRREGGDAEVETALCWRLLYALSRRGTALGRGAFLEYAASKEPLERIFSVRGLGRLEGDAESVAVLTGILEDEVQRRKDWRVACEAALALGRFGDPRSLEALLGAVEHESPHVRAAALDALGNFPAERQRILPMLRRGLLDLSTSANAAALRSLVRIVPVEDARKALEERAADEDPIVRLGAVEAAALVEDPAIVPLLRRLAEDPRHLVATHAIEALARHPGAETHAFLRTLLEHEDNGVRLSAVIALRVMHDAADVPALEAAFRSSTGDVSTEVAFNVLDTLAAIGGERARKLHEEASADPRPAVRRVARRNLAEVFAATPPPLDPAPLEPAGPPPLPGRDFPAWTHDPLVEVRTNQGSMIFELFPAETPVHVHNFLELAKGGSYDGLVFHRVVPDFVVQGGDYRGDGNGAKSWRGETLRQEFTPRKTVRGSLGMPRNRDPDSGGGQFFITHRPTPHLDGRYTIFGELRAGGEVLDEIEVGDHILGIRLLR